MDLSRAAKRLAERNARGRLMRAVPVLGMLVSLFYVVHKLRTKGLRRGGLDVALDLTPGVGRAKAVYESFRGDLIPPPPPRVREAPTR